MPPFRGEPGSLSETGTLSLIQELMEVSHFLAGLEVGGLLSRPKSKKESYCDYSEGCE